MYDIRDIVPLLLVPILNIREKDLFDVKPSAIPKSDFLVSRSRKPIVHKYQGTNRNAPCPCGSGKKYKRCCIDKIQEEQ